MDTDLQITLIEFGSCPVMDLIGEIDAYTCSKFREAMLKSLNGENPNLIIAMNSVEYIDSSGLGALVGGLKRVSEKQGRICIVCNNPQVTKVFEITGLVKVFPIFTSLEDAHAALETPNAAAAAI